VTRLFKKCFGPKLREEVVPDPQHEFRQAGDRDHEVAPPTETERGLALAMLAHWVTPLKKPAGQDGDAGYIEQTPETTKPSTPARLPGFTFR
jgi:hypothetical protein